MIIQTTEWFGAHIASCPVGAGGKVAGAYSHLHFLLVLRLRMCGALPELSHISSRQVLYKQQGLLHAPL
jgi:hypothetical protein